MTSARAWMITVLVMVALIGSVASAILQLRWHQAGHTNVLPQAVSLPAAAVETPPQQDTTAIVALAPFGKQTVIVADAPTAETVRLDVALRGVLVDPDPALSRAFVLVAGSTEVFQIGATIEGTELVAINADTITLKSDQGLHIVGFDGVLEDGQTVAQDPAAEAKENPTDPFARLAAAIVPGQGSIDLREAPPPETTQDYINLWRKRITENPQAAMDTVGVELVENGYRIKPDPNIGVTLAGLRPGDVVTRLNGQAVGDLDKDRQLYDEVAAAGIARVEVIRDGQALLLTFPLR